jgi:lipopolysaccharide transport system permease protein
MRDAESRVIRIEAEETHSLPRVGDVWTYRELLYFLIWREIKVRYKQTALGIVWVVLQPLTAMAIFAVIFGRFARIPSEGVPYWLFAFAAVVPWTYFSQALSRSATSVVGDANLIQKIYFPRVIIPIASIVVPLVDFLPSFLLLVGFMLAFGFVPGGKVILVPLFLLLALAVALAIGLWLSALCVRYRDVSVTIPFLTQVLLYASPVAYPLSMVPLRWRWIYELNPLANVIQGFRWALLGADPPRAAALAINLACVGLVLYGGLIYFKRMETTFADVI